VRFNEVTMAKDAQVEARLVGCVEAWQKARAQLSKLNDPAARGIAERVTDQLLNEAISSCLSPAFKAARKKKYKLKNGHQKKKDRKRSDKQGELRAE
jgi:hypothetical protein